MNPIKRKLRKGKTLKRVRDIQERMAQHDVAQANAEVRLRTEEEQSRQLDLRTFETQANQAAADGLSMRAFMRFQGMRDLHVAATHHAEMQRHKADTHATTQHEALHVATTERRTAERLVSIMSARRAYAQGRLEQKTTDDLTCARFAVRGQAV